MKVQFLSVVFSFLIAISAINQGFAAGNSASGLYPVTSASFQQLPGGVRADKSVLEDNNYHYLFKGKPVYLQRVKDRYTISYRGSSIVTPPRFKQQRYFKDASFRKMKTSGNFFEVMTIAKEQIDKKSSAEIISDLGAEIAGDPTVQYTAPVYCEPQTGEEIIITDKIIVKVREANYSDVINTVSTLIDVTFEKELMPQVLLFKCDNLFNQDALERCMIIQTNSDVVWAEPEMIIKTEKCFMPDDPLFGKQWHLQNTGSNGSTTGADMKVSSAWDIQQMADTNITIAVFDQGIDLTHPDLRLVQGRNIFDTTTPPSPSNSTDNHGTAVAGIAAAIGNNSIGVAGVAAGAKIMPLKILDDNYDLTNSQIASAITWAWEHGADVLNNSWSSRTTIPSPSLNTAISEASTKGRNGKGCIVLCSSGNNGRFFNTRGISIGTTGLYQVGFIYKKDISGSGGTDRVFIDNVYIFNSRRDSVRYLETFSSSTIPTGWSTSGGRNGSSTPDITIPGWSRSSIRYQQGFSADKSSFCSGAISDNQWTELRMPLMSFSAGEALYFGFNMSTEIGHDSLIINLYRANGSVYAVYGIASDTTENPLPYVKFPARLDSSIAVGASTDLDFRSDYSQYDTTGNGKTVDFLAPSSGGFFGTTTTDRTGSAGYDASDYTNTFSGTSSACPAASGLAALILSKNPHLSRNKVLEVMRSTCDTIGGVTYVGGTHKEYGHGRLNARRAIENLPPVIIGQNPLAMNINSSLTISTTDLIIFDEKAPDGPFKLTLRNGTNYTVSDTRVTPSIGYTGTLKVPASINDSTYESDICTLTVNVQNYNTPPVITSQRPVNMLEDHRYRITSSDLVITDVQSPSGPFLITASSGLNYTIVRDSIVPSPDFNGTLTVPVTASDGLASSTVFNVSVTVTAVNDAPTFEAGADVVVSNTSGPYSQVWATKISAGPSNEIQSVLFTVTPTNADLFDIGPSISESGVLTFTPKSSVTGTSTVSVTCMDNGDITNGGINRSPTVTFTITTRVTNIPPSFTSGSNIVLNEDAGAQTFSSWATNLNPGSPTEIGQTLDFATTNNNTSLFTAPPFISTDGTLTFTSAPDRFGIAEVTTRLHRNGSTKDSSIAHVFTITVNNVNDPPSFTTGGDQTVLEDAGPQTVLLWANPISSGPDETDPLRFNVTSSNPALFLNPPAISDIGTLSYTPALNANGIANVRVRIFDGADSGNIASFSITITAVNDAPSFIKGPDITIEERSTPYSVPVWATEIKTGPIDESSQTPTFNISATNATLFSTLPRILSSGELSFTPAAGQTGTSIVTVTLSDDGETANGGINLSSPQQFSITINPINMPPSFTKGPDITVPEDTGAISISSWARDINRGAPRESGQILNFSVSNNDTILFNVQPQIDSNGRLSFTTAPNRYGTAKIITRLHDNGGGNDSSAADTFTITIRSVNDLPSFTAGIQQQILEDAGPQNVPLWAKDISAGPFENDSLYFKCATNHPEFFSMLPSINRSGDLLYTVSANVSGTATIYASLHDTTDSSSLSPFTITIIDINDAPSFNIGSNEIVDEDAGYKLYTNWATSISAGPNETQTLLFSTTAVPSTLFTLQPSITPDGTLSFSTAPNANGTALVRVRLRDSGGTANGGIDSSRDTTFNITITPVNDQPIISVSGISEMTSGTQAAVTITATDPDGSTPSIVVSEKPVFCQIETRGLNTAIATYLPAVTDTGFFYLKISANDGELSTDSTISMHIIAPPPGRIFVRGVSPSAVTRINATSAWSGYPVLTGPGYITNLKNGTYSLSISESGYKTVYYYGTITDGRIDTITFSQRTTFPVMFSSALPLQTTSGALNAGGLVSVIIDDVDNDKKRDIAYTGTNGKIYICKGNGTTFDPPALLYSGFSGRNTLRCIDWNNDGLNDLLLCNINGTVWLCRGKADGQLQSDTTLFYLKSLGCTGMDIVQQSNGTIAFYTGFSDGTVQYLTITNDGTQQVSIVRDKNGQPLDVGNDADVSVFDFYDDGKMELLAGNSNGTVKVFNMKSVDTVSGSFVFSMGGIPSGQNGRTSISSGIGSDATLSMIVISDNNGAIYRSTTGVRGDVTEDGKVDVLDLQQLGIHWGKRSTEVGWTPSVNLSSSEPVTGIQTINVLDLQVLGNSWGLRK
jgi:subtilisin family serine protease